MSARPPARARPLCSRASRCVAVLRDPEVDLAGVAVVEQQRPAVASSGELIRTEGERALLRAVDAANQAEVAAALQIFFNLGELGEAVERVVVRAVSGGRRRARCAALTSAAGGGVCVQRPARAGRVHFG